MRFGAHIVSAFFLGVACSMACNPSGNDPVKPPGKEPIVVINPLPGTHWATALDVEIKAPGPGFQFYFDLVTTPSLIDSISYPNKVNIRLSRSATIHLLVKDASGRVWGPRRYKYKLVTPAGGAECIPGTPESVFVKPTDEVVLPITYYRQNQLATVKIMVDGQSVKVLEGLGEASDTPIVHIGPIAQEGTHLISCTIESSASPSINGAPVPVTVDGTPPVGNWVTVGGSFRQDTWPGKFELTATDALSGIGKARLCLTGFSICVPMLASQGNKYAYATALTLGTTLSRTLVADVSDRAGNRLSLNTLTIDLSDFSEPSEGPLPITLTTAALFNFPVFFASAGRSETVSEIRTLDLQTSYTLDQVPLAAGWNDFLFLTTGRTAWESFSIYRAGLSAALPAVDANWLVYASNSTVPGMQGSKVAEFTATTAFSTWFGAWFDVPHVWFVKDLTVNGFWDELEPIWKNPDDLLDGPYLANAYPVQITPGASAYSISVTDLAVSVDCEDCETAGMLVAERRASLQSFPAVRSYYPAAVYSSGVTEALISFNVAPDHTCNYFWDENADRVLNTSEPRVFGDCLAERVMLTRVLPVMAAAVTATGALISGIPYGKQVTAQIQVVGQDDTVFYRKPLAIVNDQSGLGTAEIQFPSLHGSAAELAVFRNGAMITSSIPALPSSYSGWVTVSVLDENALAVPALVVTGNYYSFSSTALFEPPAAGVPLRISPGSGDIIFAVREGFLSRYYPISTIPGPLRVYSSPTVVGHVTGQVLDALGAPVTQASVTWVAPPYLSFTVTDSDGNYALPVSGAGRLEIFASGKYVRFAVLPLEASPLTWLVRDIYLPVEQRDTWTKGTMGALGAPLYFSDTSAHVWANSAYYSSDATKITSATSGLGTVRSFSLPSALPQFDFIQGNRFYPRQDSNWLLAEYSAVCGDRGQFADYAYGAYVDSSCWAWQARSGFETYFIRRLDINTGFPGPTGLVNFKAVVFDGSSVMAPQELLATDVILGRTVRVAVGAYGEIWCAMPTGVYEFRTLDDRLVRTTADNGYAVLVSSSDTAVSLSTP